MYKVSVLNNTTSYFTKKLRKRVS